MMVENDNTGESSGVDAQEFPVLPLQLFCEAKVILK